MKVFNCLELNLQYKINFSPDPISMRPITIKIASAISFPKVKESCIRVAHFTLAQFMNMVSAKTKKTRIFYLSII